VDAIEKLLRRAESLALDAQDSVFEAPAFEVRFELFSAAFCAPSMSTKRTLVDFGDRSVEIDVPEHATVVEFDDPGALSDPFAAAREAIARPYGSPSLAEVAKPGMRVAIGFDDPTRPARTVQTILPVVVDALLEAGVAESDITFVCACSNHRKWMRQELADYLGPGIFSRFQHGGHIVNHDCSDPAELEFLGLSPAGRYPLEMNRRFVSADLMIYVGNVGPGGFRTYTGTGAVIGLASTRSIASHHSIHGIPRPGLPAGEASRKPRHSVKDDLNTQLEIATGKRVFYINSVSGLEGNPVGVFAGSCREVRTPAWELAESIFRYRVPQADVMVVGLPERLGTDSADNTLVAATGVMSPPRFCPSAPVLREGGVVIGLSPSRGHIDPERYPAYQEVIDLYGRYHSLASLVGHEKDLDDRPEYRRLYTEGYAYPPLHGLWLLYQSRYTRERAGAVIMAGSRNPGAFRALGITPAADCAEAWRLATRIVGPDPVTVVAPNFWSRRSLKFDVQQ